MASAQSSSLLNDMSQNGFQQSFYSADRPPSSQSSTGGDVETAVDPASSSFFNTDYKKHDDLKQMLDSNKDAMKLEAMKRIIGMVAKGKDASDLFPAVVKNVVSKNIEVKKLVYVYLTRYAEEQQDLALLSISTFQRALKDPNQLIRASALRVLSSIRVPMIVPIMMLAIKESVMDMSPYVRKTAAHAIPKLYSLDPEQKDLLIEVIEKLLGDKTTLVAGSALQAFEEVCPDRVDLIHKNYRKLCTLLVDVDEWGQVAIINMMTRYCRLQFLDPNQGAEEKDGKFYDSEQSADENDKPGYKSPVMDPDHRLLLRTCKPLLNSRNAAVVMAVAQLYYHSAPKSEVGCISRALIRLLRSHKEVQFIVLSNIATMSVNYKGMFEPYLKSFYVRFTDATQSKLLKLEILTNLATETNISTILREFQTYVSSSDSELAAATIHAIGRCASNIPEITDACLTGLVSLLSNRNEIVVGESVVIIKKLLQMQSSDHKDIIVHLARLVDKINVPLARASILWLIGEYSERVPKVAPDVLRKMAKSFIDEEDIVKLQVLNLAAKLSLVNPRQTQLLAQYVFNLAKYDQSYDLRDRARFLRHLVFGTEGHLPKYAKKIFLSTKPAPVLESRFKDRQHFQLSSLSHAINMQAAGYQPLPDWPLQAPDPLVRNVDMQPSWLDVSKKRNVAVKKRSFYSSSGSGSTEDADSASGSGSSSSPSSSASSSSASESSGSDSETSEDDQKKKTAKARPKAASPPSQLNLLVETLERSGDHNQPIVSEDSSEDSSSSEEETSSEEEEEEEKKKTVKTPIQKVLPASSSNTSNTAKKTATLLDLDDFGPSPTTATAVMLPGALLAPATPGNSEKPARPDYSALSTVFTPSTQYELLNKFTGSGLSATYKFTRTSSIFSPKMTAIEITFTNNGTEVIKNIKVGEMKLELGMEAEPFANIPALAPGSSNTVVMSVNFNDTTQPATFDLITSNAKVKVKLCAPVGELLQPAIMTENEFNGLQAKLRGMTESSCNVDVRSKQTSELCRDVFTIANVSQVTSSDPAGCLMFAAKTVGTGTDVLISLQLGQTTKMKVNCEKMVVGSMLMRDLKMRLETKA